jgi:lysophospholipase L1-like esterase
VPAEARRILLVGDSGPYYVGPALLAEAERAGAAAASESVPFCSLLEPEGVSRWKDGTVLRNRPCHGQRRDRWASAVERFDPDVVVYYLAGIGGMRDARYRGRWVHECDAAYDRWLSEELRRDADVLGARGATIVLATTSTPPWADVDASARRAQSCRRASYAALAATRPGTHVVDMAAVVAAAHPGRPELMYRDIVHLSDAGAREVAAWLVPELLPLGGRTRAA